MVIGGVCMERGQVKGVEYWKTKYGNAVKVGRRFGLAMLLAGSLAGGSAGGWVGSHVARTSTAHRYELQVSELNRNLTNLTVSSNYETAKANRLEHDLNLVRNQAIRRLFPQSQAQREKLFGLMRQHYGTTQQGIENYVALHNVVTDLQRLGLANLEAEYDSQLNQIQAMHGQTFDIGGGVRVPEDPEYIESLASQARAEKNFVRNVAKVLGIKK
jgi:uncharacterized membrane protein YsdA (DUF1294 family)